MVRLMKGAPVSGLSAGEFPQGSDYRRYAEDLVLRLCTVVTTQSHPLQVVDVLERGYWIMAHRNT